MKAPIFMNAQKMADPKFQVMPLLKLKQEEINYLRNNESYFISKFKPSLKALT